VFSSIDRSGRYAFANQPTIAHWNLTRLAETFLPILSDDPRKAREAAEAVLGGFAPRFEATLHSGLRRKIGLFTEREGDLTLVQDLLETMAHNGADFTLTFRRLAEAAEGRYEPVRSLFIDPTAFDSWAVRWRERLKHEPDDADLRRITMQAVNPAFIPRNHRVEGVIEAAVQQSEFGPFEEIRTVLEQPYEDQPTFARYAEPPEPHERVLQTFCGT
jgi:serine/tyrosine/threonine adenylyltransferase